MLETLDLTKRLSKKEYRRQLPDLQLRLLELQQVCWREGVPSILAVEGWDGAGKGGSIRRLTEKIDPRGFEVLPIAAPVGEDKSHHYMWRFWRRLLPPQEKQILIFDRSWHGRVLVERVEGFATVPEWQRAYREINDFERQIQNAGGLIAKFWFHISPEEQLRRFEARKLTPHKNWKLTDEDWRNRDQWQAYEEAVDDMLRKTSTFHAPWTVVEGEDKRWARVKVLQTVVDLVAAERERASTGKPPKSEKKRPKGKQAKRKKSQKKG